MSRKKKKRPQTIKKRLRSWLWKFLLEEMEEPPEAPMIELKVDGHKICQVLQSTIRDNVPKEQQRSLNKY